MKFGINFTSYREIARGAAECNFAILATMSGIYPKISLLLVLSQINTIASFIKVKYLQTHFHDEKWRLAALVIPARYAVDFFCVHSASLSSLVVADSFP